MNTMQRHVEEMRNISSQLARYSFPKADGSAEDDISILKTRDIYADGYPVTIYLSRSEYKDQTLDTFQVLGQKQPFLPFYLVFKMARQFLGEDGLSLIEMYSGNKKIYCWTRSLDLNGELMEPQEDFRRCRYEGKEYAEMDPKQVNFF